jgi:hypothetical protein
VHVQLGFQYGASLVRYALMESGVESPLERIVNLAVSEITGRTLQLRVPTLPRIFTLTSENTTKTSCHSSDLV